MSTPQFFEIPSTGTYRTTDGRASYFFIEGAMIPMYLAIALGLPGAAYDAVPVFNSTEQAAIVALINQHAPSGEDTGATYPLGQFFSESDLYDSSMLYPAIYDTLVVTAGDSYALPFLIYRPCKITAAKVRVTAGAAGTVTASLYEAWPVGSEEYPAAPGLPGALVQESSSDTDTANNGSKTMIFATDTFLDPGLHYIAVQFSGTPTVISIQSTSPGRYRQGSDPTIHYSGVYDPTTAYGTFDDPFDNDQWGFYEEKMPWVTITLQTLAV